MVKNKERIMREKVAFLSFLYKKLSVNLFSYPTLPGEKRSDY